MGTGNVDEKMVNFKERYVIENNRLSTPLEEIEKNGNFVQKKTAFLFDYDGNGCIDAGREADDFNNTRVSIYENGTASIFDSKRKKGEGPKLTVDLKVQREEYDKKVAEYAKREEKIDKNIKELTKYGLGQWHGWAAEIDKISTKTVNGVKTLCIETKDYSMEMPLDKNYKPEEFCFKGGEGCFGLSGFRGTFKIKPTNGYFNYHFENSDCKIICADGQEDLIKYSNSKVTIKTGDWADIAYGSGEKEVHLRPGTKTFDNRKKAEKSEPKKEEPTKPAKPAPKPEAKDIEKELHK